MSKGKNSSSLTSTTTGCGSTGPASPSLSGPQPGVIYYIDDHLGSSHFVTDSLGNVLREESRYPYGLERSSQPEPQSESAVAVDYVYTGKEYDVETGLIYFGGRYYAPELGRWITPDPLFLEKEPKKIVEMPKELNLYAYVQGNPMSAVDPNGELAFFRHGQTTYRAARDAGYSINESATYALQAMIIDFKTQGKTVDETRVHVMGGVTPLNEKQDPEQAFESANQFIDISIQDGKLGDAGHTLQDFATPKHAGNFWGGFDLFDPEVRQHIWEDVFPSDATLNEAYENTRDMFEYMKTLGPEGES